VDGAPSASTIWSAAAIDTLGTHGSGETWRDGDHATGQVGLRSTLRRRDLHIRLVRPGIASVDAALKSLAARCDTVCFGTLGQRSPISRDDQRFVRTTRNNPYECST
jgi:hypothetical protein